MIVALKDSYTGEMVYLNTDHIVTMKEDGDHTRIKVAAAITDLVVRDSAENIMDMVNDG